MPTNVIERVWKPGKLIQIDDLKGIVCQSEAEGHVFRISGKNEDGTDLPFSGTVSAVFLRPDMADVAIVGSMSSGVASVTLTDECYDIPGRFGLTVYISEGDAKTAVYAAVGTIIRTSTGTVAPESTGDVVDLINRIDAAVASIPASWTGLMADIAPTYSPDAVYPIGAYRYYNGDLYRSKVPITSAEEWTAAHWETAVIGDDISNARRMDCEVENETTNMLSTIRDKYTVQTEIPGFWSVSTKKLNTNNGDSVHHTRLVPTKGFSKISGRTYMDASGYAVAYFDETYNIIPDISVVGTGNVRFFDSEGEALVIPAAARYVSVSGWGTVTDYPIEFITDKANTVEGDIKANLAVSYADFGAVMDGVADDTAAVIACHAFANAHGVPVVQHSGTILMKTASNANCAQVKTDTDWTGATFLVTPDINASKIVFAVAADDDTFEKNSVTLQDWQKAQLVKNTLNINFLREGYNNQLLTFETDISIGTRNDGAASSATTYRETVVTDRNGGLLDGALFKDMSGAGSIRMVRRSIMDKPITIKGGKFLLQTDEWMSNPYYLYISRANVTVEGLLIDAGTRVTDDTTTYRGEFIRADHAFNLTFRDCVAENFSTFFAFADRYSQNVAYIFCVTNSSQIMLDHCVLLRGWGSIQTSWCKHMTVQDCTIGRVDNHYGCRDYLIDRCTLVTSHSNINVGFGDGYLIVRDCKFIKTRDYDTFLQSRLISCREDFCALYSGTIVVDNVFVESEYDVTLIAAAYESTFDYLVNGGTILPCSLPKIEVKGVHVTMLGNDGNFTLMDYGVKAGASVLTYQTAVDMPVAVVDGVQSNQAGIISLNMESVVVVGGKYAVRVKHSNMPYTIPANADRVLIGDWKAPVIVGEASGAVASFADGADDMTVKDLTVQIDPVQDLNGYDNPWPAGGGKNLVNYADQSGERPTANLSYQNFIGFGLQIQNGVTYTFSADITSTVQPFMIAVLRADSDSSGPTNELARSAQGNNGRRSVTFTGDANSAGKWMAFRIQYNANTAFAYTVKNVMVEIGSTATAYAPYSNICPITGWTGAKVTNIGDATKWQYFNGLLNGTCAAVDLGTLTWRAGYTGFFTTGLSSTMDFSGWYSGNALVLCTKYPYATYVSSSQQTDKTFTFNSSKAFIIADSAYTDVTEFQSAMSGVMLIYPLATPTTPTITEEQFTILFNKFGISGNACFVSWQTEAGTVYGGSLDVTTGVLTVDRAMLSFDGSETWNHALLQSLHTFNTNLPDAEQPSTAHIGGYSGMCNRFKVDTYDWVAGGVALADNTARISAYRLTSSRTSLLIVKNDIATATDFTTWLADNPIIVVYHLATPVTYQLTPQEIRTLLGQNNIWADTGNVAVSYPADTKLYIERRIAEAVANALNA